MRLYLVREAGATKVHGIFWAQTSTGLRRAVGEMADPVHFEWAEITSFGGVWRGEELGEVLGVPDSRDFPLSEQGEAAFNDAFDRAFDFAFSGFGERLVEMIANQGAYEWTRFGAAEKGAGTGARVVQAPGRG